MSNRYYTNNPRAFANEYTIYVVTNPADEQRLQYFMPNAKRISREQAIERGYTRPRVAARTGEQWFGGFVGADYATSPETAVTLAAKGTRDFLRERMEYRDILIGRAYTPEILDMYDWEGHYPVVRDGKIVGIEDCAWPRYVNKPVINDTYIAAIVLDWEREINPEWDSAGAIAGSWYATHGRLACRIDRSDDGEYAYTVSLDGSPLAQAENEDAESFEAAEEAIIRILAADGEN